MGQWPLERVSTCSNPSRQECSGERLLRVLLEGFNSKAGLDNTLTLPTCSQRTTQVGDPDHISLPVNAN